MVRVAIGGIEHETNTYAAAVTGLTDHSGFSHFHDDAIMRENANAKTQLGGFIYAAGELGYEVVPTYFAIAVPSGTIEKSSYEKMKADLVTSIKNSMPIDAVALDLHGAGVSEGIDDIESDIGKAVRDLIGPDTPLVCSLDLHGNIYDEMASVYDGMIGYRLYPHEDMWETGHKAFHLLPRLLAGKKLCCHIERLPMVLPTTSTDESFPHAATNRLCAALEEQYKDQGLLHVSLFHGFPFTDITQPTPTVMALAQDENDNADLVRKVAVQVALQLWGNKDLLLSSSASSPIYSRTPEQAVAHAMELSCQGRKGPVVVHETNDNTGCGGPGDGTWLLQAMLKAKAGHFDPTSPGQSAPPKRGSSCYERSSVAFGFFCDPDAVAQALDAQRGGGVGSRLYISLGGKSGSLHGPTLEVDAYVKNSTDGKLTLRKYAPGMRINLGRTVRLIVDGIDVIVTERRNQTFDTVVFEMHAIDVSSCWLVAVKSSIHFRAGFRELDNGYTPAIVTSDAPGLTTNNMRDFKHTRATSKLWPIDGNVTYTPSTKTTSVQMQATRQKGSRARL